MPKRPLIVRLVMILSFAAITACLPACTPRGEKSAGPPEKVTIAISATTESVLAEVAQMQGFFKQEGLEVLIRKHPYGRPCLEDMLAGNADFATVAETPVMFAVMKGEKISVLATIEASRRGNALVARRDRGIATFKDIKGKRVGVTMGTVSDFFLDAILTMNGVSRKEITPVDLKAEKMPQALADGEIDGASTFNPYTIRAQQKLGDNAATFQDENLYTWTFNLVARQEFIRANPEKVRRVLRALVRAEEFVGRDPATAQKNVADFTGFDRGIVSAIWEETNFRVSLDQQLLLALEDESEWAIRNGMTGTRKMPNYLDNIYIDGLKSVRPEAVRILR